MAGVLYLVATPIGNLGDMTQRAIDTLEIVDFIAAEDTRVSVKILNHFNIKKSMISYFEHNKRTKGEEIVSRLEAGESCALVTDAGMPAISDPGEDIVALCAERGVTVTVIPGACAAVSALAVSGLPTGRFCFEGFLSANKKARKESLQALKDEERTLIFYEAPHKLNATLKDMLTELGDRRITFARELTKLHEEIKRTTLSEAVQYYDENAPRGEFVLIVEGKEPEICEEDTAKSIDDALNLVKEYIDSGLSHSDAVKRVAQETGIKRSELYNKTIEETN